MTSSFQLYSTLLYSTLLYSTVTMPLMYRPVPTRCVFVRGNGCSPSCFLSAPQRAHPAPTSPVPPLRLN